MLQQDTSSRENLEQAVFWYQKAAELGDPMAQTNLGWMMSKGIGLPEDVAGAMVLFRKAAEQEYSYALNNIGHLILHGKGQAPDAKQALDWFRRAADLGLAAGAAVILTVDADADRSATSVHLGDRPVSHTPGET